MHDRVKTAFNFFVFQGWTPEQSAGIVGNLIAECGAELAFETATGDGGTAHGLAQWRNERVEKFEQVFGFPLSQGSFEDQLYYVHWELTNAEQRAGKLLKQADSAASAAAIVDQYYERSSGEHRNRRISYANSVLAECSKS